MSINVARNTNLPASVLTHDILVQLMIFCRYVDQTGEKAMAPHSSTLYYTASHQHHQNGHSQHDCRNSVILRA